MIPRTRVIVYTQAVFVPGRVSLRFSGMPSSNRMSFTTIPELVRYRATLHPHRLAARFIADDGSVTSLSYGDLLTRSLEVASKLNAVAATRTADEPAPRAMLLFPPGLDFLPAFFGAQIAGWIPVTTCYPKPHRAMPRIDSVVKDCSPTVMLTNLENAQYDRSQPVITSSGCVADHHCGTVQRSNHRLEVARFSSAVRHRIAAIHQRQYQRSKRCDGLSSKHFDESADDLDRFRNHA